MWHHMALCMRACVTEPAAGKRVFAWPLSIHKSLCIFLLVIGMASRTILTNTPNKFTMFIASCMLQSIASQHFMISGAQHVLLVQAFDLSAPLQGWFITYFNTGSLSVDFSLWSYAVQGAKEVGARHFAAARLAMRPALTKSALEQYASWRRNR